MSGAQLLAGAAGRRDRRSPRDRLAVAQAYARYGAEVAIADIDVAAATTAAAAVGAEHGVRCVGVQVDVADEASLSRAADAVEAQLGRCDVVVANAGILLLRSGLEISPAQWRRVLDVNLTGAFLTVREFARRLIEAGSPGRVIVSSSLFGRRGGAGNAAYAASKFGLIGLVESLAADLAANGILVNAVCPGQISTDMLEALLAGRARDQGRARAAVEAEFVQRVDLGRLGTTAEVADAYVYLASDLSTYVTGQSLVVDGGWSTG